jgi:hypothetical protein
MLSQTKVFEPLKIDHISNRVENLNLPPVAVHRSSTRFTKTQGILK